MGNPVMINAYKAVYPGNGKPFPTAPRWRRSMEPEKLETFSDATVPGTCMTSTSW
jgi:hypothetical protein